MAITEREAVFELMRLIRLHSTIDASFIRDAEYIELAANCRPLCLNHPFAVTVEALFDGLPYKACSECYAEQMRQAFGAPSGKPEMPSATRDLLAALKRAVRRATAPMPGGDDKYCRPCAMTGKHDPACWVPDAEAAISRACHE